MTRLKLLAFLPLLFVGVGAPLALRLVPPNPVYGVRTAAALASTGAWYDANSRAGLAAVLLGFVGAIVSVALTRRTTSLTVKIHVPVLLSLFVAAVMVIAGAAS